MDRKKNFLVLEGVGIVHAAVTGGEGLQLSEHEENVLELVTVAREMDEDIP